MPILVVAAGTMVAGPGKTDSRLWGENYIPNTVVRTQDGNSVRFYDDLIKGKIVIISFIYTSCTDICPLTTARLSQLEDKLGDAVGRDVFMISMTVDPKRDTPARLKEFSSAFQTGPGWTFVTGDADDIRAINYKFGDRSEILSEHRNEIVLGNDATGEWQRDSAFGDLNRLVMTIRGMDPKWRDQVRPPATDAATATALAMSNQPGQALFKKICAPCHTIGVGDRVGPDLRGVTARRDRAWLSSFIQDPAKLRAAHDPDAMALVERFPAVRMPAMGVARQDAADLMAFIDGETARLREAQGPDMPVRGDGGHAHHHH
ncbi:SCO family protein [Bradyrhizobium manausense]|uniref:SCO family protein n=1 Tax=Bradyrhizobium manausense TaxID=989370 RepID=UPI001BA84004|nr:SCO family protein [Bradyrhizobium manausense]MBR0793709.1 SCO family protein [Bradyrhizobium manausense]